MTIDGQAVIDEVRRDTGLDDFGAPTWTEGFDRLVAALNAEANLNAIGHHAFALRLRAYLTERLRIVDWRRRHPEMAAEPIDAPVIITGLPRTGTTALSNLLAQDPDTRSLRVWESAAPTPPPEADTYATDPRIEEAQRGIDLMGEMLPELRRMHDDTALSTAEAIDLLGMSFRTHHFGGMARIPSYDAWVVDCDMRSAYRFHRDVLQLLQWRCPPRRWHLKNPPDVFCLEAVADAYPDAVFIWTHRNPVRVLPSVCSLIATVRSMTSDEVDRLGLGAEMLALWSEGIARARAFRRRNPGVRFVDVYMDDLVADPMATIDALYDALGWQATAAGRAAIETWSRENPPGRHGAHRPGPSEFGLRTEAVRQRFADYITDFDLDRRSP